MTGLKNVQVTTTLYYEDGVVVTFATPMYGKDIRQGELYTEDDVTEIITESADCLSELIVEQKLKSFHDNALHAMYEDTLNKLMNKKGFSDN